MEKKVADAVLKGDVGVVSRYLDAGGDPNYRHQDVYGETLPTLLHLAIKSKNEEMVELLLGKGAKLGSFSKYGSTELGAACDCGVLGIVKALLKAGADPNALNEHYFARRTPLADICILSPYRQVPVHTDTDLDTLDEKKASAIRQIIAFQKELISLLFEYGAKLDPPPEGLFRVEAAQIMDHMIKTFGVDAKTLRDDDGKTLLFRAKSRNITQVLLAHGCELEARDNEGRTALHEAAGRNPTVYGEDLTPLLEAGADVEAADPKGWRPVHMACKSGWGGNIQVVIQWGADLSGPVPEGFGWGTLEEAMAETLLRQLPELLLANRRYGIPIKPQTAWLKWLLASPVAAPKLEAAAARLRVRLSRDEILQPFKDRAWEKRKHLVHCYFETRRLRKEAREKRNRTEEEKGEEAANATSAAPTSSSELPK